MEEQKYFKQAMSDFTFDAACGGAIRHLADLGYSVKQIMEQLSFPVPYERVQKTVWEHYIDTGILVLEEPGKRKIQEKADYVREYNQYGKASFRRVVNQKESREDIHFKEHYYKEKKKENFKTYFTEKCRENEMKAYVLLDFGAEEGNVPFQESLQVLDIRQQDYMRGLFEGKKRAVYHRINAFVRDIIIRLYENDKYHGVCYFMKTKERLIL